MIQLKEKDRQRQTQTEETYQPVYTAEGYLQGFTGAHVPKPGGKILIPPELKLTTLEANGELNVTVTSELNLKSPMH